MFNTRSDFPLSLGSCSEGTLRPQDLLATGVDMLDTLARHLMRHPEHDAWDALTALCLGDLLGASREIVDVLDSDGASDEWADRASEIFGEIVDFLTEIAPPFVYFGAAEGDGACYGFWIDVDAARDGADGCGEDTPDPKDAARDGIGAFLHVNDHGNATLYHLDCKPAADGEAPVWREVWSVV